MKTATLTGADLNRAVAMALGHEVVQTPDHTFRSTAIGPKWSMLVEGHHCMIPDYAGDIAVAWPIIEGRKISTNYRAGTDPHPVPDWRAVMKPEGGFGKVTESTGPTAQIAAMRCFVASVYGDDINLENP